MCMRKKNTQGLKSLIFYQCDKLLLLRHNSEELLTEKADRRFPVLRFTGAVERDDRVGVDLTEV